MTSHRAKPLTHPSKENLVRINLTSAVLLVTAPRKRLAPAVATMLIISGMSVAGMISTTATALAVGGYSNAAIATTALRYVGQPGANACRAAHKPGDTGGQCREFVNCVVWMVSDHQQNLSTGSGSYFRPFLTAGGGRITNINDLVEGDIVQVGEEGTHTFIIVKKLSVTAGGVGTFNVVDSNHEYNERVMNYDRTFTLSNTTRAYQMGSVASVGVSGPPAPASPAPTPPASGGTPEPPSPTPAPVSPTPPPTPPPATYSETTGSVVH